MLMAVTVLRLGHRPQRDKRVTTHCALVARAFGARELVYSGERDKKFEETVKGVVESWGGPFTVKYTKSWRSFLKSFKGKKVQLTMYGLPLEEAPVPKGNLLVVVGSTKVPPEVYGLVDLNVAVGGQPHSEIAALAVYLYRIHGLKKRFTGAKIRVVPSEKGKKTVASKG
ncbi:MAG: tRNA (cytidine(56)-2'-O)-methyltransferase [Candidatus Diapherotrites archaeon]|nr:tRNA (cytidine(56)-2'-O)-methyltransferase [Candidatus Diapherotrites archaeon]